MAQQKNTYDCGVYVCRYIYNMYLMRNRSFKGLDIETNFTYISESAEFKFTDRDINLIRLQLNILFEKMTILYKNMFLTNKRNLSKNKKSNEYQRIY